MRTILLILLSVFSVLHAQEEINHYEATHDDGDPELDADGVVNKIVVWKGGATHTFYWNHYNVQSGYTLVIQAGATVNGWELGGTQILGENDTNSRFQITGANLNNIFFQRFHASGSFIENSRLNNSFVDLPQGCQFRDNEMKTGILNIISPAALAGVEEDPPLIMNNYFEESFISALGSAILIQNNTFSELRTRKKTMIDIGYARSASGIYPSSDSQTWITGNTMNGGGILMDSEINRQVHHDVLDGQPLNVLIQGNTIKGGGVAISPLTFSNTQIINNEISGFAAAVQLKTEEKSDGAGDSREPHENFLINNNVFSESNSRGMEWRRNYGPRGTLDENDFVDATGNYWGHETGPNDASNVDGFFLDGQGLSVEDYITYTPFQGQKEILPELWLDIRDVGEREFFQGATYFFDADVAYTIYEGPAILEIVIKDDQGRQIADPTPVTIQAGEETVTIENIEVQIPATTDWISCQAIIWKDDKEVAISNIVDALVFDPGYGIRITDFKIQPTQEGKEEYIPGVNTQVTFKAEHTFPDLPGENTGRILVSVNEYKRGIPSAFLQNFDVQLFSAGPGENQVTNVTVDLLPQLRDIYTNRTKIIVEAKLLVNGEEKTVFRQENNVSTDANKIELSGVNSVIDGNKTREREAWDRWGFCIEEKPVRLNIDFLEYQALTPHLSGSDFAGWRVTSEIRFYYRNRRDDEYIFYGYSEMHETENSGQVFSIDIKQESEKLSTFDVVSEKNAGADFAKLKFLLHAPNVGIVYERTGYIDVVESYKIERYGVPVGESQVNLSTINCRCTFREVEEEGELTVIYIPNGAAMYILFWVASLNEALLDKSSLNQNFDILLDRYWEFFCDLPADGYSTDVILTYDPEEDFPDSVDIDESTLTVAIWDTTARDLVFIPTLRNAEANELTVTLTDLNTPIVIGVPNDQSAWAEKQPKVVIPEVFSLEQNYPNPFNGETVIQFALPGESSVRLTVFDLRGRVVTILLDENKRSGVHKVSWNGRSADGQSVTSGLYVCRLEANGEVHSSKMLYMK